MFAVLVSLFVLVGSAAASAQSIVFLVRHAERADAGAATPEKDPSLSAAGEARAESLANLLKDAGITTIFTTEFARTQQTAAPLARRLGLTPTTVPGGSAATSARIATLTSTTLVVGHSNTVPEIIKALGVTTPVVIADTEFDNLFIVYTGPTPRLIRLRYR